MRLSLLLFLNFALTAQAQPDTIIKVNLENEAVHRFMEEVYYVNHEDTSLVNDYNVSPPSRRDIPKPVTIPIPEVEADTLLLVYADSADISGRTDTMTVTGGKREATLYNLVPQRTYYYRVMAGDSTVSNGEIHTEGQVRMIFVLGVNNIRDIGGWPTTDGKRVRYGMLYRGTELNGKHTVDSAGLAYMVNMLDIKAELDLRASYDTAHNISAFGYKSNMNGNGDAPTYYYTSDSGMLPTDLYDRWDRIKWRREFNFIVNNMAMGRNVYVHCVWGCDRTGYLLTLLEGLLGMDYDSLIKEYELSCFYSYTKVKGNIEPVLDYILECEGNTLQEKFNNYFVDSLGVFQENVDFFRNLMLEEVVTDVDDDDDDDDDLTTAIRSFRREEDMVPTIVCDLRGRRVGRSVKRGLLIEIGRDGKARKIIR